MRRPRQEEIGQLVNHVTDVDRAVPVAVEQLQVRPGPRRSVARRLRAGSPIEEQQQPKRVADIDRAVTIGIAGTPPAPARV